MGKDKDFGYIKEMSAPSKDEQSTSVDAAATPAPAESTARSGGVAEPVKLAAKLLFGFILVALAATVFLVVLPLITEVAEEDALGVAYLTLLRLNLLNFVVIIIDIAFGVIAYASLWDKELSPLRKRLFWGCIIGIFLSVILYFELTVPEDIGQNLWQGEGPPGYDEFISYVKSFVSGSVVLFASVILGIVGASPKDFIKAVWPWA